MTDAMKKYAWIMTELKHLGHPYDFYTADLCLDTMNTRDLCKKIGVDYSRMNWDDRRKVYWYVVSGNEVII